MSTRTAVRKAPVVPPQHGAWGFLALPLLLGIAAAGWSWGLLPLAVAWVAAHPGSWALTGLLTARRPGRFRRAALLWTPVTVLAGVPLLVTHRWLAWFLLGYLVLYGVNLQHARKRRERALVNDLVLVAECVLLVPVVAGVVEGGAVPWAAMAAEPVLAAVVLTALTLAGSTLHVKSLIRERANPAYTHASRAFALAAPLVVGVLPVSWWLVVPFVLLAARALWWHNPSWRPARIGLVELAGLGSVAAAAFLAF